MADAGGAVLGAGSAVQLVDISGWVVVRIHFAHSDYMPCLGSRRNFVATVGHWHCSFPPLISPLACIGRAASSTLTWALWCPFLLWCWNLLCFLGWGLEGHGLWRHLFLECWCRGCEICRLHLGLWCVAWCCLCGGAAHFQHRKASFQLAEV